MKKLLSLAVVGLSFATFAKAQDPTMSGVGVRVRVGYEFGSSFTLRNGSTGNLSGPLVGLDFSFAHSHGLDLAFSPSIVLAGALKGGSTNGSVYRFTLSGRKWINKLTYVRLEAGFANTQSRSNQFNDVNDFIGGLALGFRLGRTPTVVSRFDPLLEIGGYVSRHRELNGVDVSLNFGF